MASLDQGFFLLSKLLDEYLPGKVVLKDSCWDLVLASVYWMVSLGSVDSVSAHTFVQQSAAVETASTAHLHCENGSLNYYIRNTPPSRSQIPSYF